MSSDEEFTLSQIQEKLDVPQHVLIHLCEKNVIRPDFAQTEGRGKWRKFSKRNLFEFAVALVLRKYEIPVSIVGAVINVLQAYESATKRKIPEFSIPDYFGRSKIRVLLFLCDGETLIFEIHGGVGSTKKKPFLIGFNVKPVIANSRHKPDIQHFNELPKCESFLNVNLSEIAKRIS